MHFIENKIPSDIANNKKTSRGFIDFMATYNIIAKQRRSQISRAMLLFLSFIMICFVFFKLP
jgi:hypothetical protein